MIERLLKSLVFCVPELCYVYHPQSLPLQSILILLYILILFIV